MTQVFKDDFSFDVPDRPYIAVEFDWEREHPQEAKGPSRGGRSSRTLA